MGERGPLGRERHLDRRWLDDVAGNAVREFCSPAVSDIGLVPTSLITDGTGVPFDCVDVLGNSLTGNPTCLTRCASYRAPLGNTGWNWVARVDWRYIGEQFLDDVELLAFRKQRHSMPA